MEIDKSPNWVRKELDRLKTLVEYEVMDTPEDEYLNGITELASRICNTPIALISLLDSTRQWFKAKVGLDIKETPKDISFCQYAIEDKVLFQVKNALEDDRFKENPFVVGNSNIRFYAGMPIAAPNGSNLGTLCVIDTKVRELNEDQKVSLGLLSKSIIQHLEIMKINKELKALNDLAKKLSKAKDDFLSNMSHELRTPLNAIYGFTEILLKTSLNEEQKDMVSTIKTSGEVLITLINDILDFSKIESGKIVIENVPFDLKKTALHIQSLLKPKCIAKGVDFRLKIDPLPNYIFKGDKVRLNQILINLHLFQ